ncbi:NAD(P)-binding protein [Cyanobium sp. WAJ14-Wanaka]|uniref:NAD(P)-binding protein n=1 Tax=Cyanobium sp. WAJ14-Wanaka TaxID=2823725 RepID=UPI0020CD739A|nr:NAD(P)-binding protein [Cyanobium sp. WAJ14-Wanaka]MCP9774935.1 NAD(P)-binding protein [Cyanobium sp. WAJ14-Wanaka]
MAPTARPSTSQSIAVIGAGVAGCALVAQLRRLGVQSPISLWETGRGPGGRASTRFSRLDGGFRLDHGAPLLNLSGAPDPQLLAPLLEGGWLEPWAGRAARLEGEAQLRLDLADAYGLGGLWVGKGGMHQLGKGLLQLAGPEVEQHFGSFVRHLQRPRGGPWRLLGVGRELLVEADWLVLSSTLLAHPRSQLLFGWPEAPLKTAAASLGDLQLDHALTTIAGIRVEARSNLLLVIPEGWAHAWLDLPFGLLHCDGPAQQRWGIRRVSIQPLADGRCGVVVHSSDVFAADHLDVYGSHSAVATMLQLPPDGGREETVISALTSALVQMLAPWLGDAAGWQSRLETLGASERQLMRWAAAFPVAPGLPTELMFCRQSRVGFCGDYLAGVGFGRIEGAWRRGEELAALLVNQLQRH